MKIWWGQWNLDLKIYEIWKKFAGAAYILVCPKTFKNENLEREWEKFEIYIEILSLKFGKFWYICRYIMKKKFEN